MSDSMYEPKSLYGQISAARLRVVEAAIATEARFHRREGLPCTCGICDTVRALLALTAQAKEGSDV